MRFKASGGLSPEYQKAVTGHSPWQRGAQDASPLPIPGVWHEQSFAPSRDALEREGIRAVTFIPLELEAGVFGKFMLYYSEPYEIDEGELEIAQAIGAHIALAADRKRAEFARVASEQRLEATSRHLAAVIESSDDAIISKDLNGIVTSWNRGAERIFLYQADEIIGSPVSELADPDRRNEMPDILSRIRRGERVDHYETRRRRKDGVTIDIALTVSTARDAAGNIVGASKIARDITLRTRGEQERVLLLSREQEARRTAELLNQVAPRLAAQLNPEKLVQEITDIATRLPGAGFGAFFHNAVNEKGESYVLYTISGVSREAFEGFPMPRNTEVFVPTFRGEGVVRSDDIRQDPRYGKNESHHGMPKGHLPGTQLSRDARGGAFG
jgi:PAS domain S-box-containing protein